ncbi:MAG: bifunctional lysylphosphatidylglycerol flippase/synthetase MprF [Candidatus Margulisiibacteriota bacterium]
MNKNKSGLLLNNMGSFAGLALFFIALITLFIKLEGFNPHHLSAAVKSIPAADIYWAVLFTFCSYFILSLFEYLSFIYTGKPLAYRNIVTPSFLSNAFSYNVGFGLISASSIRFRIYNMLGVSILEVTRAFSFYLLVSLFGFLAAGGISLVFFTGALPDKLHFITGTAHLSGVVFLLIAAVFVLGSLFRKDQFKVTDRGPKQPAFLLSLYMVLLSSLDWIATATVLFILCKSFLAVQHISFINFLLFFLAANAVGMASHIPAGLGVFEASLLLLIPGVPVHEYIGAVLVYRLIYYILPFLVALVCAASYELYKKRGMFRPVAEAVGKWLPLVVPQVFMLVIFAGGAILLFSGALPAEKSRLVLLRDFLPLSVIEISHFLGSISGIALLFLARGIQRRLNAAYYLTILAFAAGIVFSLLKGFDFEEAFILAGMLVCFIPTKKYFYRKTALIDQQFSRPWLTAIIMVLSGAVWLGFFSYKHVEYSGLLWWQFSFFHGDAPRFMRATVGVFCFLTLFAVFKLFRAGAYKADAITDSDKENIKAIVSQSPKTYAYSALITSDKCFMFNEKKTAFIMYGVEGRSWITIGGPVGPQEEYKQLIWQYRELCDKYDGLPVFNGISEDNIPYYLDMGLTMLKIGEEGMVPLDNLSMEGGENRKFRHIKNRLEREGCSFEIIPPENVEKYLPELKDISGSWLENKHAREKRFNIGFFDEDYLKQCPLGIVRSADKIVAFSNILGGAGKQELSIDLMRYSAEAPENTMEYLFIEIMLWGKNAGYQWFNLGLTALSGLEPHALASFWNRIGFLIFSHGEYFYNFQGLRRFKEKFDPVWKPIYLAAPTGLAVPRVLMDISTLNSGGFLGLLGK